MAVAQQWTDLEGLSGIGPGLAAGATGLGFRYSQDLLRRPPRSIAGDLEQVAGISARMVDASLVPQAELVQVPGLGLERAARLVAAGVTSMERLAWADSGWLAREAGGDPRADDLMVTSWQLAAARRVRSATVTVQARGPGGVVPDGVTVQAARPYTWQWQYSPTFAAGPHGAVLLEMLRPGPLEVCVRAPGHRPALAEVNLTIGDRLTVVVDLDAGVDDPLVVDEFGNGVLLFAPPAASDRAMVDRSELAGVEAFEVLSVANGLAVLQALQYRQFGVVRFTYATQVPEAELPPGAGVGSVLEPGEPSGWSVSTAESGQRWRSARTAFGGRHA